MNKNIIFKELKKSVYLFWEKNRIFIKNLFDLFEQKQEENYKKNMITRYTKMSRYGKL